MREKKRSKVRVMKMLTMTLFFTCAKSFAVFAESRKICYNVFNLKDFVSIQSDDDNKMLISSTSLDQRHGFELLTTDAAGCNQVDACGFNGRMAQEIGESRQVVVLVVKSDGEKVAQVVRKHLARRHATLPGQTFHSGPYAKT